MIFFAVLFEVFGDELAEMLQFFFLLMLVGGELGVLC